MRSLQMMKPQDLLIIAKLLANPEWKGTQSDLAKSLFISQSEISESLARSKYAQLLDYKGKEPNKQVFLDFVHYGLRYVFPQQPGAIVRGTVTAHSALPLSKEIVSKELYVWPYAKGNVRGHSILPLYPSVLQAIEMDKELYAILALMDAVRVGRVRERTMAMQMLTEIIC